MKKIYRLLRSMLIGTVAFVTIMATGIGLADSNEVGGPAILFVLLSFLVGLPYWFIALNSSYLPRQKTAAIDVSPLALQTHRISAIPTLIRRISESPGSARKLGFKLFGLGVLPLFLLPVCAYGLYFDRGATVIILKWIMAHSSWVEFPLVLLIIIFNRCLRAGYGLLKLDGACRRVGWDPAEWLQRTHSQSCAEIGANLGENFLRIFGVVFGVLGMFFGAIGSIVGFGIFFGANALAKSMGRRRAGRSIQNISAREAGDQGPILYLRGFKDDPILTFPDIYTGLTIEETICLSAAEPDRRIVALGKPGEKLPPLGASRFYVGDDEWQEVISSWIARSQQIIMVATTTGATKWEKEETQRNNCLPKLLILFPLRTKELINETLTRVQDLTGIKIEEPNLDEKTKLVGIYFLADATPRLIISTSSNRFAWMEAIKWHKHQLASEKLTA